MAELILRLAGPAQSWAGYRVNASEVPTRPVPTVSGVAGLLGACLGVRDHRSLVSRFSLRVRLDRHNAVAEDLQVAAGPLLGSVEHEQWERAASILHLGQRVKAPAKTQGRAVLTGGALPGMSTRGFIPHAEFICALDSDEADQWAQAVADPVWMPYLGRRGNAPSWPFLLGVWSGPEDIFEVLPRAGDQDGPVLVHEVAGDYHSHTTKVRRASPPVTTREEQLSWISANLER